MILIDPIKIQILQLESHGSQLSGAKNRTFLSCPVQILLQRGYKKRCTVKRNVIKIDTFLQTSQETVVIS
jgi:hypothetical protein